MTLKNLHEHYEAFRQSTSLTLREQVRIEQFIKQLENQYGKLSMATPAELQRISERSSQRNMQ